jgi:hypothetical protein
MKPKYELYEIQPYFNAIFDSVVVDTTYDNEIRQFHHRKTTPTQSICNSAAVIFAMVIVSITHGR